MNCRIEFSASVKADLKEIDDWYRKISKHLVERFYEEYNDEINFIRENPFSKEKKYDECRICNLNKFPFAIHYQYFESQNSILIIGIYHSSRNPNIWKRRL